MAEESRGAVLSVVNTKTKVLALVTLVVEATFLGSLWALPKDKVFGALIICAGIFLVVTVGVIAIELFEIRRKREAREVFLPSPRTPGSPLLNEIIRGAVHTVCRGVTVPKTPEEAKLRAFIFKKEGNQLVCTHFWAPDNLLVKEEVGLAFDLNRNLADQIVVVRAYFDRKPARTDVKPVPKNTSGVRGELSQELEFVLAVPIFNKDSAKSIWGVVDFDTSNQAGRAILSTSVSDTVMYHLAEHLRLLVSLSEEALLANA